MRAEGEGLSDKRLQPDLISSFGGPDKNGIGIPKHWRHQESIFSREEKIDGSVWKHYAFATYDSLSSDPAVPGIRKAIKRESIADHVRNAAAVHTVTEVYTRAIDEDHSVIARANFSRHILEDMEWQASRSAILGELVRSLSITPVSEAVVEEARATEKRRIEVLDIERAMKNRKRSFMWMR